VTGGECDDHGGEDPSAPNTPAEVTTREPDSTSHVDCSCGCRSSYLGVSSFQTNRGVMEQSTEHPNGDKARRSGVSREDLRREQELHDFSRLHPTLTVEQIREWCASGELATRFPTLPELFSSMSDAEIREWCESGEQHRGPIPSLGLPPNPGLQLRQARAMVAGDPEFMARYPELYRLLFSPRTRRAGGRSTSSTCPRSGCTSPSALPRPGCLRGSRAGRRTRTPWRP
jgi:hypothetical protein